MVLQDVKFGAFCSKLKMLRISNPFQEIISEMHWSRFLNFWIRFGSVLTSRRQDVQNLQKGAKFHIVEHHFSPELKMVRIQNPLGEMFSKRHSNGFWAVGSVLDPFWPRNTHEAENLQKGAKYHITIHVEVLAGSACLWLFCVALAVRGSGRLWWGPLNVLFGSLFTSLQVAK